MIAGREQERREETNPNLAHLYPPLQPAALCRNRVQGVALRVEGHDCTAEVDQDEESLPKQPRVFSGWHWGVVEAGPDVVEDEVSGKADDEDS